MSVCIDRCVCHGRTFQDLHRVARDSGAASVEALQQEVAFGTRCGLCRPYVRSMLETGQTVFYEVRVASSSGPP